MKHVVKVEDSLVVIDAIGFTPKNSVGVVPENTAKEDYPYLALEELDAGQYRVYVDYAAKVADIPRLEQALLEGLLEEFRAQRNRKLLNSDWTQLQDSPLSMEQRIAWANYRQVLRDLPNNTQDFENIQWPEEPS